MMTKREGGGVVKGPMELIMALGWASFVPAIYCQHLILVWTSFHLICRCGCCDGCNQNVPCPVRRMFSEYVFFPVEFCDSVFYHSAQQVLLTLTDKYLGILGTFCWNSKIFVYARIIHSRVVNRMPVVSYEPFIVLSFAKLAFDVYSLESNKRHMLEARTNSTIYEVKRMLTIGDSTLRAYVFRKC